MNIEYVIREIKLNELTNQKLSSDTQWLINYFKSLVHSYEKNGNTETWYDKDGQWTIKMEENLHSLLFYYKNWIVLEKKYRLNYQEITDLIKGMLELTLNRKVNTPPLIGGANTEPLELTLNRKVNTPLHASSPY